VQLSCQTVKYRHSTLVWIHYYSNKIQETYDCCVSLLYKWIRQNHKFLCYGFDPWYFVWAESQPFSRTSTQLHISLQAVGARKLAWFMPRSHQTFRLVSTVKLLGIMFRSRCWPTTFYTITAGDVNGWCLHWPLWSTPQWACSKVCGSVVDPSNSPTIWPLDQLGDCLICIPNASQLRITIQNRMYDKHRIMIAITIIILNFVNLGLFRHFEIVTNIRTWIKSHKYWRML
jgi:hypothetical protein